MREIDSINVLRRKKEKIFRHHESEKTFNYYNFLNFFNTHLNLLTENFLAI